MKVFVRMRYSQALRLVPSWNWWKAANALTKVSWTRSSASDGLRVMRMAAAWSWSRNGRASRSKRAVRCSLVSFSTVPTSSRCPGLQPTVERQDGRSVTSPCASIRPSSPTRPWAATSRLRPPIPGAPARTIRSVEGHHPAVEQYLETILELEESGVVPMRARLVDRLGVSAPAVSETVRRLEREGYLTLDDDRVMHLTATGRAYATSMLRRHRLAELLLVDILKVPWAQVHEEACRLEHAISDNLEAHLVALLGDPGLCPHGNPIPGSANAT